MKTILRFSAADVFVSVQVLRNFPKNLYSGLTLTIKNLAKYQNCRHFAMFISTRTSGFVTEFVGVVFFGRGKSRPECPLNSLVAGDNLTKIKGVVIFFRVEFFETAVHKVMVHGRFVDDCTFVMDSRDIDDRRLDLLRRFGG